jgi:hypothetical protein
VLHSLLTSREYQPGAAVYILSALPALWENEAGELLEPRSSRATKQHSVSKRKEKKNKTKETKTKLKDKDKTHSERHF